MKKLSFILFMLFLAAGSIPNAQAQLGKLGKKVSNKVKTEERKAKKAVSNTKKTGKLPKTGKTTVPSVKTPTKESSSQTRAVGAKAPSKPSTEGLTKEEDCRGVTTYFKTAYKELGKVLNPQESAEELSVWDMEVKIKQVKTVWLKKIKDRDHNCDTSKLEAEVAKAEAYVKAKKGGVFFMPQGDYTITGVWDKLTVDGSVEYGRETNIQSFILQGSMGQLEGTMSSPAGEEKPEYFVFEIKNFGNGVIIPSPDANGNIEFYQFAVLNGEDILAMAYLSNNLDRNGLEKLADRRAKKKVEEANLDPFIKNNLGKVLVSTEGPIFVNGKENGQAGAAEVKLTTSLTLGQPIWVRTIMEDNRTPMELLKLTGYPPAGEIGAAIRTRILFDGEEVGQDLLRCTKPEDVEIVTNATSYREKGFDPNGAAQDAYREGFEGIFAKNPSYGEHIVEFKKYIVNYNLINTEAGEGEEKFPLEVLLAESGPIKVTITENSWKAFCNSGENNYGPTTGVVNSYSKSILALAKKEAARSNWKETPFSCRYVGKYEKYHEVTGVHMYPVYKGAVKSRMPNGSIVEQIILMANGAFYGVGSNTHRYLPPKCN